MWSMSGVLSPKFGYLPESLGILWKLDDNQTIGMIGREVVVPRPEVNQQRVLIPFFALAKKDEGCPEDLTLLTQLICWNSSVGATPRDVFLHLTGLIFGAIRSLFDRQQVSGGTQVDKYRLIHDSHAQNILLQLDSNGYPQRVIWRDFQHIYPVVLDQEDNLDDLVEQHPFLKVLDMCKEPQYVVKKMSQLIDTKLGMYVLEPLITNFATDFNCHRKDIIANVRDQFRETLGPINQILRKGVWYRRSKGMKYDDLGRIRLVKGRGTPLLRN